MPILPGNAKPFREHRQPIKGLLSTHPSHCAELSGMRTNAAKPTLRRD